MKVLIHHKLSSKLLCILGILVALAIAATFAFHINWLATTYRQVQCINVGATPPLSAISRVERLR